MKQKSLTHMEISLLQEEDGLTKLESLVAGRQAIATRRRPEDILEWLLQIEETVARIEQLEATRARQLSQAAAGADGSPGDDCEKAANAEDLPASDRSMAIRHRLLGCVARIAQDNEANRQLLEGLIRTNGTAIARLALLRGPAGPGSASLAGEGGQRVGKAPVDLRA